MTERPILFSGPMVRALLDGRKTQTRRVVNSAKNCWRFVGENCNPAQFFTPEDDCKFAYCRIGQPGDRLWVRETFCVLDAPYHFTDPTKPRDVMIHGRRNGAAYRADVKSEDSERCRKEYGYRWRPSIHMPRWASRLTLEITGVRVERVQEISEEDARAEGVDWASPQFIEVEPDEDPREVGYPRSTASFARDNYRRLWDSLNKKRGFSWDTNPWVWVIEFKVEMHRR